MGFLNSDHGGILLIGVDDRAKVHGLAEDFRVSNSQKQNQDGYQLFLQDSINKSIGLEYAVFYELSFHSIHEQVICQIKVRPANKPAFYRDELYVRIGNQTSKFKVRAAIDYCKQRWPNSA